MINGIIAEYNPFHNGHLHMINQLRQVQGPDAAIIACISGGLTQRGELPVLDKWQRASLAVQNGVNLVLELPALFAGRSAQHFAWGGVTLLHRLGVVDNLAFGTIYPDMDMLRQAAQTDLSAYQGELQERMKSGEAYASAAAGIIAAKTDISPDILKDPNTILAVEYIKALHALSSSIQPIAIQRQGANHTDSTNTGPLASGTAIRNMLKGQDMTTLKQVVPSSTYQLLSDAPYLTLGLDKLYPALRLRLLQATPGELQAVYSINEGLEYKLKEAVTATSLTDFMEAVTGKRYQRSRISRLIIHLLLNITHSVAAQADECGTPYARVLAFDDKGRALLKKINEKSTIPVVSKVTDYINRRDFVNKHLTAPVPQLLYYDIMANNLFQLAHDHPKVNQDFIQSPIYLDKAGLKMY